MTHQLTISPAGNVTINSDGVVVIDSLAPPNSGDYSQKPVKVVVHRDLTIQLHGRRFDASVKLTPAQAMGLINMLGFVLSDYLAIKEAA